MANRELRFRAWDALSKEMFIPLRHLYIDGNLTATNPKGHRISSDLMQFTGLRDKNDVEIYEGDLLRPFWATDTTITAVKVCYKAPKFYLERTWTDRQYAGVEIGESDGWQVVGNIYENPELLESD